MNRSKWIASGGIVISTLALALGYTLANEEILAPAVTILGILWLVAFFRGWHSLSSLALIIFVGMAGFAAWKGYSPWLMLIVLVSALSAWDLNAMIMRISRLKKEAIDPGIENRHLTRLAVVDGVGLSFGIVAMLVRVEMSLVIGLLLGLGLFLGLSQLISYLRKTQT